MMLPDGQLDILVADALKLPKLPYTRDYNACRKIIDCLVEKGQTYTPSYEPTDKVDFKHGLYCAQFGQADKVMAKTEPLAIVCAALRSCKIRVTKDPDRTDGKVQTA